MSFLSGLFGGVTKIEAEVVSLAEQVEASDLYGIVKGVAEIAVLADPALGVIVNDAIAVLDLLLADVRSASHTAAMSVPALKAAAATLLVQTASVVTVTPNKK